VSKMTVTLDMPETEREPEDMEELLKMTDGMTCAFDGDELPVDQVLAMLLRAADGLSFGQVRTVLEVQNPLANAELLDAMAILNTRLRLVDLLMHLPMAPANGR